MDHSYAQFLKHGDGERIVEALEAQQYVRPHQPLGEALAAAGERVGFCPGAASRALEALRLDGQKAIGRLRRTELAQLGRVIHRYWRQNAVAEATSS